MKWQILLKLNIDLLLIFYLFRIILETNFNNNEKAYKARLKCNMKIFHIKFYYQLDKLLYTGTSNSLGLFYAKKSI